MRRRSGWRFLTARKILISTWADPDNTYGSRELAASLALSGDLKRVKAMILVDMVGPTNPDLQARDRIPLPGSPILCGPPPRVLATATCLYNELHAIEDDHLSFLKRDVPSADIIDLENVVLEYWHTPQDTLDKIDPRTLAITGHVLIESVPELEKRVK